jgi:hypothetical protein
LTKRTFHSREKTIIYDVIKFSTEDWMNKGLAIPWERQYQTAEGAGDDSEIPAAGSCVFWGGGVGLRNVMFN